MGAPGKTAETNFYRILSESCGSAVNNRLAAVFQNLNSLNEHWVDGAVALAGAHQGNLCDNVLPTGHPTENRMVAF